MEIGEFFGEPIHTHSRAQAMEDGVLVELSAKAPGVCRQHFKVPVGCTEALWDLIQIAISEPMWGNDLEGVLHDIFWMSRTSARELSESVRLFPVIITGASERDIYELKATCGPGDEGEPTMLFSMAGED